MALQRHNNPNSIVNRKINEDPSEYKFVCTLHDGRCKKFFKTEKRLRVHIRTMGDKKYPDRGLARQFMANITQPVKNPDDFVLWPSKEKPGNYSAIHPVFRNVLLQLSLKVTRACLGSR